jgi:hypothetical protein
MAVYTPPQLYGSGSVGENLSGTKTFAFNNPYDSSYFTLETVRNPNGFYDNSPTNFTGSWSVSSSMMMGFNQSPYIASLVIPNGISAFTFTPASAVTGTTYRIMATGAYTLTIT